MTAGTVLIPVAAAAALGIALIILLRRRARAREELRSRICAMIHKGYVWPPDPER